MAVIFIMLVLLILILGMAFVSKALKGVFWIVRAWFRFVKKGFED